MQQHALPGGPIGPCLARQACQGDKHPIIIALAWLLFLGPWRGGEGTVATVLQVLGLSVVLSAHFKRQALH